MRYTRLETTGLLAELPHVQTESCESLEDGCIAWFSFLQALLQSLSGG